MTLLAAGALGAAVPTWGADVTNLAEFVAALNNPLDEDLILTGTDIDLLGQNFALTTQYTQFFGDGTPRTLSNGTFTVTGSTSDTNYNLLNLATNLIYTGDIVLNPFSKLIVFDTTSLSLGAAVEADNNADIQLYTFAAQTVTWDQAFFNRFSAETNADPELISFSFIGPGTSILTGLPTFDAELRLDEFADFEFAQAPQQDPTAQLGASLTGNHDVVIAFGTLDLNDFDLTVDSISGADNTDITLGSGTLTTGDNQDTTYAGVISGTGNLTKTGTGSFTLSGVNTYTGTTTVSAGTLILEADQTGPTAVIIQNGGTMRVNADQTGTPTYTVQTGGTLDLFADLADTTAVTVDGLMDLNSLDQTLGSISGSGSITLGAAALTVGDATNTTFSGVISGTAGDINDASFTKAGTGNLTLSGINTYTGATTINAGTLTVDGSLLNSQSFSIATGATMVLNGDISNTAPVAIAAGGTLDLNDSDETLGLITGAGDITLGTATLTVGTGANSTFDGTISETGNLIKQNAGTITFTNAQTYTGTTTITGGTVIANGDLATSLITVGNGATLALESTLTSAGADVVVDAGGTLFGTGTIADDLTNNGTVTFFGQGAGDTLTVNGDYTQGAAGLLEVRLGSPAGLVITGNAALDGTLDLGIPLDPANFDITTTHDVLTAGSTSGNFSNVTDDFVFLDLSSNLVGGNVQISLTRNAVTLASIAQTPNHTTIANVLDGLGAPTGTLEGALNRILASSGTGALATYDDLAGAGAATASTQLNTNVANQNHRLLDQVIGVTPGSTRPLGAFRLIGSNTEIDETDHLTLVSNYQAQEHPSKEGAGLKYKPWGAFYGGFGDQGDGAEGLDYTRYGLLVGLELDAAESDARYGLSLGVEQSEFDFSQDNGNVDVSSIYLSGYGRLPLGDNFNFTIAGGLGFHDHESTRNILIGVTPTQANADFSSVSVSLAAELSKTFDFAHTPIDPGTHPTQTSVEPFIRIAYSLSDQDGYNETGAGAAGLNVSSSQYDSIRAALGLRVQHQYMLANQYEATFQARALANVAISDSNSNLNVSFVGAPGTTFNIEGSDQDDAYAQLGLGLSVEINRSWDMHFNLDQQIASDALGTVFSAGLSYEF